MLNRDSQLTSIHHMLTLTCLVQFPLPSRITHDAPKVESLATLIGARSKEFDAFFAIPFSDSPVPTPASSTASASNNTATGTNISTGTATATTSSHTSTSSSLQQTSGGLNGVATFVKKGRTVRASARELDGGGELDREGRCLMTDHGAFCVFNVYIPNAQGGNRLPYKQKVCCVNNTQWSQISK